MVVYRALNLRILNLGTGLGVGGLVLGISLSIPPSSYAQTLAPVDPSRIQQNLREELPIRPNPSIDNLDIQQPNVESPLKSQDVNNLNLIIKNVNFQGNTILNREIQELVNEVTNSEGIRLQDIPTLVEKIENLYRSKGYELIRVIIPEQTIKNSSINIEIIEGFIEEVKIIEGEKYKIRQLSGYINNILEDKPTRLANLERNLLLINELAGYKVSTTLETGKVKGGIILVMRISRKKMQSFFEVNNWGTETVGPVQLQSGVILNSLGNEGEQIFLSGATSLFDFNEIKNVQGGIQIPVGRRGVKLGTSINFSETNPGSFLKPFKIRGEAFNAKFGINYPLIRSFETQANLGLALDLTNNNSFLRLVNPPIPLYVDRTRNVELYFNINHSHDFGSISGNLAFKQGIDALGARSKGTNTIPVSNSFGKSDALKIIAGFNQVWQLPDNFNLVINGTSQIATQPLFVSEQFGIGGSTFNSAYQPSQLIGDSGYSVRAEIQKNIPYTINNTFLVTQPYIFADYGKVFRIRTFNDNFREQALSSAGFGFRQNISNITSFRAELGFPLTFINKIQSHTPMFHFSIQSIF